jgi:DNA-binding transcriptional LysR family regulator
LGTLHRDYPEVQIEMKHPCNRDLVTQVMKGEVMLGLGCTRAHYPQGLAFCRLGHVTFVNAAHKDHPLSQLPNVRFAQLADHLQLILSDQVTHLLTTEYLKSAQRWHVHSQGTLIEILKNGIGWAIVPKRLIAGELASGELVELKLQSYPVTDWTIGLDLIWSVESKPGRVTAWLKSEIMRTKVFV